MNPTPPLSDPANNAPAAVQQLQQTCRSLQTQLLAVLITMFVFIISLNIYLYQQLSMVERQKEELEQYVQSYTNSTPRMNGFLRQLQAISHTNTELALILAKYRLENTNPEPTRLPAR